MVHFAQCPHIDAKNIYMGPYSGWSIEALSKEPSSEDWPIIPRREGNGVVLSGDPWSNPGEAGGLRGDHCIAERGGNHGQERQ